MNEPQGGILPEPGAAAHFMVVSARDRRADGRAIVTELARVPELAAKLAASAPGANLRAVVSLGADLWQQVSPSKRPRELAPFATIEAGIRLAPATGGDALLHVVAERPDLAFELTMKVRAALGDRVTVIDEVPGFRYLDGRDLTGFIDGTENPKGDDRADAALVGGEDVDFAGGSYVIAQRYVHNLTRWALCSLAEQEGVIGRSKSDSVELGDDVKPPHSHIGRVVIEEDGEELEIVRHSFPYGTTREAGLFFIAYGRTRSTFDKMLARMYGTSGDGEHDHLMDYTHAVSGGYFFAPSLALLASLARG
jgi:putative iron-dependent peroxidase